MTRRRTLLIGILLHLSTVGWAGDTLRMVFTGDLLLDRGVRQRIERVGTDRLFSRSIDSLFSTAQVVVANLECPATKVVAPVQKWYIFRGEPEWLATLRRHGITHLNLANNHSIDQGRRGLVDTRAQILEAGMVPVGVGDSMPEATAPVLLAASPRPVFLLVSLQLALENFVNLPNQTCVSQESIDSLIERVGRLRAAYPDAYIIVSPHWGGEHTFHPVVQQKRDAHRLIEAGADVLIGHHTHTLQTIEQYKGHAIYYSVGNFIFDQNRPINTKACAVVIQITDKDAEVSTVPLVIESCVPRVDIP